MRKKKISLLFTCVGRRVSLITSFRQAAKRMGYKPIIIGTDTTACSAALQTCDRKYLVKPVKDRGYADEIMDIVAKENVDILVPTVDLDLSVWARRRDELKERGTVALVSRPEVVTVCQDKRKTYAFLKKKGFNTPHTMSPDEVLGLDKPAYPYFLKPWDGYASRGNFIVTDREELAFYSKRVPNCLVQEYIEGQEHTVDVLVDFEGTVRCVVPRLRLETRGGEVSKGRTVKHMGIIETCKSLVEVLKAGPGVITIQCFLTADDQVKIIEINPRFGGGVPLSIKAGAAFPLWLLEMWAGKERAIGLTKWRDGLTMLRYDEAVWVKEENQGD